MPNTAKLLACLATLALIVSPSAATELYEGDVNEYNFTMTDYHITIKSKGPVHWGGGVLSDDGEFPEPDVRGDGTNELSIDWWYLDVPSGDAIGFCIKFEAGESYSIEKSFTAVKGTVGGKLPVLGGIVGARGNVGLTNAYDLGIRYENARWAVDAGELAASPAEGARLLEAAAEGYALELDWKPLAPASVPARGWAPLLEDLRAAPGSTFSIYYEGRFEGGDHQQPAITILREQLPAYQPRR